MNRTLLSGLMLFCVLAFIGAQEDKFSLAPSPRFWGASLFGRYSLAAPSVDQVETTIIAGLSAAYETVGYYRAPDGSLFTDGVAGFNVEQSTYSRFDLWWQIGVQQGLLARDDLTADKAVAFAYYRGRFDLPSGDNGQIFYSSGLPEVDRALLGSVHTGLVYSNVTEDAVTGAMGGLQAEAVIQWGPSFLHNQILGSADFTRATLSGSGFIPIYARARDGDRNLFSSYIAMFGAIDWATGPEVPMSIRSTIGSRSERPALGGSIRGFESGRFDADLKMMASMEVRLNLRSFTLSQRLPALMPGLLMYTDAGYYYDLESLSPAADERSGTLLSSGAGLSLDVRGVAQVVFYTIYLWQPATIEGRRWVPFSLGLGFHY